MTTTEVGEQVGTQDRAVAQADDENVADPVDAAIAAQAPEILNRLNHDFEDSVLLVGRVLGSVPGATAAEVTALDRAGIDVMVTEPQGPQWRRLDFLEPVSDPVALSGELINLVLRAREVSGEEGLTSAEREIQEAGGFRTFLGEVVAVRECSPHLREVTVRGDDLRGLALPGPDAFVYLLLPPPGRSDLTIDGDFTWEAYRQMAEAERPVGAYYTVRRCRPEVGEVDLQMVLHGDAGPAGSWAAKAAAGDPVALWGPRTSFEPPATTEWYLLVADETGLPATAAILESLPEGTVARVFAEVASGVERQELPVSPSFEVMWLHRDGAPAGTTSLLADAVRAMAWPGGAAYAWGGGESRTMASMRRYLRHDVGLDRESVSLIAYWRHANHADEPDED